MAVAAFWRTLTNPDVGLAREGREGRIARYEYLRAWYSGVVFLPTEQWASSLRKYYRLYRHTRLLWNPIPPIINFWAGIMYPGILSSDGLPLRNGDATAVPLPEDVAPELAAALAQIWTWGNWQAQKSVWPRHGALMGNGLLEVRDLAQARKVYLDPTRPEYVSSVTLNPAGDVLDYALEYRTRDLDSPNSQEYVYRKVVTRETISTFREDKPWSYGGVPAVVEHGYGFCPAVWVKHREVGGVYGEGAILSVIGTLGALAEVNSLQSQIDDSVRKSVDPLTVFATEGDISPLFTKAKRGATDEFSEMSSDADRESLTLLKAPIGTTIHTVEGSLNIGDATDYLLGLKEDFKLNYPEYTMYPKLREMTQITGPAAEILLGDIATPVREIRANYDRQLVKACQMAISIAAMRAREWEVAAAGALDDARRKFMPFDEGSYFRGELDFEIGDRPLVPDPPLSAGEKVDLADKKINKLGMPPSYVFQHDLSIPEETVMEWEAEKVARAAEMQAAMQGPGTVPTSNHAAPRTQQPAAEVEQR